MKRFYVEDQGAEDGPFLKVTFDGDEVSLDIAEDGITLFSGWSLLPVVPTKVRHIGQVCRFAC